MRQHIGIVRAGCAGFALASVLAAGPAWGQAAPATSSTNAADVAARAADQPAALGEVVVKDRASAVTRSTKREA